MDKAVLLNKKDRLVEQFGAEFVLENLCMCLSSDVLEEKLRYLHRQLNIPFEQTEDDDE